MSDQHIHSFKITKTKIPCPYCGHLFSYTFIYEELYEPKIILCDSEEGGCGQHFVLESKCDVTINVKISNIEGRQKISADIKEEAKECVPSPPDPPPARNIKGSRKYYKD